MEYAEVIRRCRKVVADAGFTDDDASPSNFLDFSNLVRDVINSWSRYKRSKPETLELAAGLRELRDDFVKIVEADPMVIYKPANRMALGFHKSNAYIRHLRGPNRSSKTQSGCADNYWVMTGQHPYRPRPPLPSSVAVVTVNFSKSANAVFVPKYVSGEGGNPLSPMFPEGGKWFYHWDQRKYILTIACPECANRGKAGSCTHTKSKFTLFSDIEGPLVLAGGQYAQIQFDEQISYAFFSEALKRLETVPNSGLMVTETPLGGKGFWTNTVLARDAKAKRVIPGTKRLLVSIHTCSQYEAGLTPKELIDASRSLMTEQEAEARIYGRPAAFSETSVFDNGQISLMIKGAREGRRGDLWVREVRGQRDEEFGIGRHGPGSFVERRRGVYADDLLAEHGEDCVVDLIQSKEGSLCVWEDPQPGEQYIIGADVAQGLTDGDPSCAQVLKMRRHGMEIELELVASYHGWVNSLTYATELFKLGLHYNHAHLVPERRGTGDATIQRLKELNCWFLFRDVSDPSIAVFAQDARFGLDTNVKTKGTFVSVLQKLVWDKVSRRRRIEVWDLATLEEMGSFGQEKTPSGQSIRFRGESGTHDDRVMALAIGAYAALNFPLYDIETENERRRMDAEADRGVSQADRAFWAALKDEEARYE